MIITKNVFFNTKSQLIILVLLALGLNFNTLFNSYALDDVVVISENTLVKKGIKGIPEIISHDFFYGNGKIDERGLSGGRYRPFALVVFAIEYQFFGSNPFISHLINSLLFAFLVTLLYQLFQRYIFREQSSYLAFVTCLLFVVHPIHTEVIANIKSRDELITFILLIASVITFIKYIKNKSKGWFLIGLLCFFLALLTRESAIAFIVIIPMVLFFFFNYSLKKSFLFSLPLIAVFLAYMLLRFSLIGFKNGLTSTDILNNPFLYATYSQALATKVFILFKYVYLLFFPFPLSSDYAYNQIPYINLISAEFIFSFLFIISLIAYAFYSFKKNPLVSFSIFYFFVTISLVSNFVVNIGTPLAERFLFQPSLAFCIVMAGIYCKSVNKFKLIANSALFIVLILFAVKTLLRNSEWKNNETLFFADVIAAPNSLRTNQFSAELFISKANLEPNKEQRMEYFKKAVFFGERALKLDSSLSIAYMDLGSAYYGLSDYFKAADLWIKGDKLLPNNPETKYWLDFLSNVLYREGNGFYEQGKIAVAVTYYKKSIELNNNNVEAWYNLGGCYFKMNDNKNGMEAWRNVLKLSPNHVFNKDEFIIE